MEPMDFDSDTDYNCRCDVSPMQHSGWDGQSEELNKSHNSDFKSINTSYIKAQSPRSRWNTYHNIVSAVNAFTGFKLINQTSDDTQDSSQNVAVDSFPLYRTYSEGFSPSNSKSLYPDLTQFKEDEDYHSVSSQEHNKLYSSAVKDHLPSKKKRKKFDSASLASDSPIRKLCEPTIKKRQKQLKISTADNSKPGLLKPSSVQKNRSFSKILFFLSIVICVFIALTYYTDSNSNCSSYTDINFSELTSVISSDLYGQHIASRIISTEIETYFLKYSNSSVPIQPLVFSLHGWTGVGKNYITWLIYHSLPQTTVTKFLMPLHFAYESKSDTYSSQIFEWLMSNVTQCKVNIFILDEMDKAPKGVIAGLSAAISHLSTSDIKSAPVIIFLLSNSKGTEITRKVLGEEDASKKRKSFTLEDFKHLFWQDESLWYSEMLSHNLISAVVPFLPLERKHVIKCIKRNILSKGYIVNDNLVDNVLHEMSFFTVPSGKQYSQTGCKRVSDKVDLVHVHL